MVFTPLGTTKDGGEMPRKELLCILFLIKSRVIMLVILRFLGGKMIFEIMIMRNLKVLSQINL